MKNYIYKNIKTEEEVEDFMAESYVLDKLGITITPKGVYETYTPEQLENIEQTIDWFFSGNWIKEEVDEDYIENDEDEFDLEKMAVMSDMMYDEYKDREMGLI